MAKKSPDKINGLDIALSQDEASKLADELSAQLQMGRIPYADKDRIHLMIAGLGDSRGTLRRTFAKGLGAIGKACVPPLSEALLHHPNVTIRRAAAKTLKLIGDPTALPDLLSALKNDPDPVVQGSAVGAMAIFGEKALKLFLEVLEDPSSTALQSGLATWGVSFISTEDPESLLKAAESKHPKIRAAAIAALGHQLLTERGQQLKILIGKALKDHSSEVRSAAAIVLGQMNNQKWVQKLLIPKVSDLNAEVRKDAVLSLMKINAINTIPILQKRELIENDPKVLKVLRLAINKMNQKPRKGRIALN